MKKVIVKITKKVSKKNPTSQNTSIHRVKIERGAKDFVKRFEGVMRELSNG